MARYISFAVLLAIIVVIGALFYKVMIGFFIPVFLAAVLVVVFRPLHRWVCSKVGERDHISAGITTTLILLIVLIPAGLTLTLAAIQGVGLVSDVARIPSGIQVGLAQLRKNNWVNLEYPHAEQIRNIQERVTLLQQLVTTEPNSDALKAKDGELQKDIKGIVDELNVLPKVLLDFYSRDVERYILDSREPDTPTGDGMGDEVRAIFSDTKSRLDGIYEIYQTETPLPAVAVDDAAANAGTKESGFEQGIVLLKSSKIEDPDASFSTEELEYIQTIRTKFITTLVDWKNAIVKMKKALNKLNVTAHEEQLALAKLTATDDDDVIPFPQDVIEFQREALRLSESWTETKNVLLGGEWVGLLREVANPTPEQVKLATNTAIEYLQPKLLSFTGDSFAFLVRVGVGAVILLLSLYFFLCDGPAMIRTIMELSPLDDRYELELLAEFDRISRAIVLATVLSALFQGVTAGIGYYFVGMPSLILLTALTCTCALVPFVGPAIVWVPVCIYLALYRDSLTPAIGLAIWGTLIVGSMDNIVKILVLHGQSQLHPLLALLSVLGGIQALGPIGILIGPMVVVLLQTLLGILRQELTKFKKNEDDDSDVSTSEIRDLGGLIRKTKSARTEESRDRTKPEVGGDEPPITVVPAPQG